MLTKLMHEGGFPMWFIVLFGLSALVAAALYAKTVSQRYAALARGLAAATLMATLAGTTAALGAVFAALAGDRFPEINILKPDGPQVLLKGLAEAMSPGIMGFALLALCALFYAVGSYRTSPEQPASRSWIPLTGQASGGQKLVEGVLKAPGARPQTSDAIV